ncbi:MAG: hypothetical protein ACE5FO_11300, partial [Parvularculaceae bacterium]
MQSAAEIKARSYIWQPWFAQIEGEGAVAYERQSGRLVSAGEALRFAGDFGLNILPMSRFPTTVSVSRVDSRVGGRLAATDFVRDRVAFSNSSILTGKFRTTVGGSFDRTTKEDGGDRNGKRLYASATKEFGENILGLNGLTASIEYATSRFVSPTEEDFGEDTVSATFSARMTPGESITNNLHVTFIQDEDLSETTHTNRKSIQAVDSFHWAPHDKEYNLDGFIRVRREEITLTPDGEANERRRDQLISVINFNIPLHERLHFRLGFRGGLDDQNAASAASMRPQRRFAAFNASLNYTSNTREFGDYEWRWGARAAGETGFTNEANTLRKPRAAVNQTVQRDFNLFEAAPLEVSFTEEVGFDASAVDRDDNDVSGVTPFISHGLSFAHNRTTRTSATTFNMSVRDFREIGGDGNELQTAQLQFNRRQIIDTRQTFTGVMTFNGIRRRLNGEEDTFITASGRLVYGRRALFDVSNLDFRSELAVNIFELEELFSNNPSPTTTEDIQHHEWRNILTYRIGLIAFMAEASLFYEDEGLG